MSNIGYRPKVYDCTIDGIKVSKAKIYLSCIGKIQKAMEVCRFR